MQTATYNWKAPVDAQHVIIYIDTFLWTLAIKVHMKYIKLEYLMALCWLIAWQPLETQFVMVIMDIGAREGN